LVILLKLIIFIAGWFKMSDYVFIVILCIVINSLKMFMWNQKINVLYVVKVIYVKNGLNVSQSPILNIIDKFKHYIKVHNHIILRF